MFESLSETYKFTVDDFPQEWLPLTHLYDPDLPLYPTQYFHRLNPSLPASQRPGERDRVFGFIHHVNLEESSLVISLVLNKDLANTAHAGYVQVVESEARARLGLEDPVYLGDIQKALTGGLSPANALIEELWYRVVQGAFGNQLPFGRIWDPVLGLVRWIASFYSNGRKAELIQTHSFVKDFGVMIPMGSGYHADFFLLPTWEEFTDLGNPLSFFGEFTNLLIAARDFTNQECSTVNVGSHSFSKFELATRHPGQRLNTANLHSIFDTFQAYRSQLLGCFSAFDRGPLRTVIALMMFDDLRSSRWNPLTLTNVECGEMYIDLEGARQTPKVIQLYSQQCFGNEQVLPIDNWIETFLSGPLNFTPTLKKLLKKEALNSSAKWGRIERVIWVASQARKVHSTVCADILWCVRYGAPKNGTKTFMRSANPLSCKICASVVRNACPAYASIEQEPVVFNASSTQADGTFLIGTSAGDNVTGGQTFVECRKQGDANLLDVYSPNDEPAKYSNYPSPRLKRNHCTVKEFVSIF